MNMVNLEMEIVKVMDEFFRRVIDLLVSGGKMMCSVIGSSM